MSWSLFTLCAAAFAIVATAASTATGALLPQLDRLSQSLGLHQRVRFWLVAAVVPAALATLTVLSSFVPAAGWARDHCLDHGPHHPHLCPHHLDSAPGLLLVIVAFLMGLRAILAAVCSIRSTIHQTQTCHALRQASDAHEDVWFFDGEEPAAFVLGALRPHIFVTRALLALGDDISGPAIAHEKVHAERRHLLWRLALPLLSLGHLPHVASALQERVSNAQEMTADDEGAQSLPNGRLKTVNALLTLAKVRCADAPGLHFAHGNLEARARALLKPAPRASRLYTRLASAAAGIGLVTIALAHDVIHHGLETLLGVLS